MTQPTDYFPHPQAESGQGLHTQESGNAGLSSNMEHNFSDSYIEGALPVADKCSVRPIPKGELDIFERPEARKIWSLPPVFVTSRPVTAGLGELKPSTVTIFRENNPAPQATPMTPSENNPEEKTAKVLARATAIMEEHRDVDDSCITDKMDVWGKPKKPKGPPLGPRKRRRNSNHYRKRSAGKNWKLYLLFLMPLLPVPVSEGSAVNCFTCKDKGRCPKLLTIFNKDDKVVYEGAVNQTFPRCCESSPPPNKCAVCWDQSDINIICSEDVGRVEVEDGIGPIDNISSGCAQPSTCNSAHYGLVASLVLTLVAVAALVINSCC